MRAVNTTVSDAILSLFLCPSDPNAGRQNINSYARLLRDDGRHRGLGAAPTTGAPGCSCTWASYGIRDCPDGTSMTIAFSEALVGDGKGSGYGGVSPPSRYRGNMVLSIARRGRIGRPGRRQRRSGRGPRGPRSPARRHSPPRATSPITAASDGPMAPPAGRCSTSCRRPTTRSIRVNGCRFGCNAMCDPSDGFSYPASSDHPGGVNVLFADGSVRFVKDAVNRNTWWSLGTRAGGEVINSDSY